MSMLETEIVNQLDQLHQRNIRIIDQCAKIIDIIAELEMRIEDLERRMAWKADVDCGR
jgi:hypothetical protein